MKTAISKYVAKYKEVLEVDDPIMFAVSLLPCSRLWVWLATKLEISCSNAYYNWVKSNREGHPEKFRDLINKYLKEKKDVDRAQQIFKAQMKNEFDFFQASLME